MGNPPRGKHVELGSDSCVPDKLMLILVESEIVLFYSVGIQPLRWWELGCSRCSSILAPSVPQELDLVSM
jgi:hypothetical protein